MLSKHPALFAVAPVATDITSADTKKIGCTAGMETLTLQGVKLLHNRKHAASAKLVCAHSIELQQI
jgi:hypothetical protein